MKVEESLRMKEHEFVKLMEKKILDAGYGLGRDSENWTIASEVIVPLKEHDEINVMHPTDKIEERVLFGLKKLRIHICTFFYQLSLIHI